MMKRSVIFFDIDGTLAPFMFEDLRKELNINTFVSYNGQYVVLDDEVLYTNPLNIPSLEKLTEAALQNNHPVVFMDHEDMKANVQEHAYINESIHSLKIGHFPTFDPNYYKGRDLYQTLLFCPVGEEKQYEEKFQDFDFVRWHPLSVDVIPKGGSKAKGIEQIVNVLRIPHDRHYAFGDGLNDIEMLSTVKNSVAMGNAVERVKIAAKHVTKTVEDNGITYGLKMLGLL